MSHSVRHILLLISLLIATMCFGQVLTQKGVSYRYNGKNPRTPLPSVIIECDAATNTVISDSITGEFSITFQKLKMGDRIGLVKVKKREMMVFNQHAVDEWSIRKEPLCLILCDANEFDRQKQELIAIGKREAQKKYDRQKADLEQLLEASQIDRARYEAELDTAWQELDRLHKHIDEYADLFARIDQSEIDTLAQQAMDLFNQGKVDEAVQLFEQGNYLEKLRQDNRTIQQADQLIEAADQAKANAEEKREMHIKSLKAQVEAYKMQNEWKKAKTLLKGLADEQNTFMEIVTYASFCHTQNDDGQAEIYYKKAFDVVHQYATNDLLYDFFLAGLHYSLAQIYFSTKNYQECEQAELKALEIYKRHADQTLFQKMIANTLDGLGGVYYSTARLKESEDMHMEALKILRKLAKDNPKEYEPDLAFTLNNLGNIYNFDSSSRRPVEAESMYLEALKIRRSLAKEDPQTYELYVARTLNDLAILYEDIQRFSESEALYLEALEIYRLRVKINPEAYYPGLALTMNNLGIFYQKTQHFVESEAMYLEALEIRSHLAKDKPWAYESYLAQTLDDLANLYDGIQRLTESEAMHTEALKIWKRLANRNPQIFEDDLAASLCKIGLLHIRQEQYQQAISDYEEALEICRRLALDNSYYSQAYHQLLYFLSQLYPTINEHTKHYEINEEWLPILKSYYQQEDGGSNQEKYVNALGNQSFQCIFVGQLEQSEQYARDALTIDSTQYWIYTNLAAALLFQGKYNEAEAIYRQYKDEKKDSFLQDFDDFEAAGVIPEERKADVEKIRKLLLE